MPTTDELLTFLVASFVLIVIPGPSVLFTIGRALSVGRRGALLTIVGNASGGLVQVIAVAIGIGSLVERSAEIYLAIKYVGAAYLVFLGVQAIRHRHALSEAIARPLIADSRRRVYFEGLLVGVTNPKTIVFFTIVMPQFANRSAGHLPLQLLVLGAFFPIIALGCDTVWATVAGTARNWFANSPRRLAAIGGTGGLAIVGLGVSVAVTGRKN